MQITEGAGMSPSVDTDQSTQAAATTIKDSVASVLESGKRAAAETAADSAEKISIRAESAATALRRAAEDLQSDNRWIGVALRKSADTIESAAQSLNGGDLTVVVRDLNGFARRQPMLFLGASVALGFAAARVGKTAIEQATDHARAGDHGHAS